MLICSRKEKEVIRAGGRMFSGTAEFELAPGIGLICKETKIQHILFNI
jgi:hypothetical protein